MYEFKIQQIIESTRGDNSLLIRVGYGALNFTVFYNRDTQRFEMPRSLFISREVVEDFFFVARRAVTDFILNNAENSSELPREVLEDASNGNN